MSAQVFKGTNSDFMGRIGSLVQTLLMFAKETVVPWCSG